MSARYHESEYQLENGGSLQASARLDLNRTNPGSFKTFQSACDCLKVLHPTFTSPARKFSQSIVENDFQDASSNKNSVDQCLKIGFEHTGDSLDLELDLIEPICPSATLDRYPLWFQGANLPLKLELARVVVINENPDGNSWVVEEDHWISFKVPE